MKPRIGMRLIFVFLFTAVLSLSAVEESPLSCRVEGASASATTVGLLCDDGRAVWSEANGSAWKSTKIPTENKLRVIHVFNSQRALAAGDDGTLLETADAGENWRKIPVPTQEHLTSIHFIGDSGWISGWGGIILHSADAGRSWEEQPSGTSQSLESIYFTDALHGWAVGWVGAIVRTADGGKTWMSVRTPAALWSLSSVYFRDAKNGWAVGFAGQLLRSRDGGLTWEKQTSPVDSWLTDVFFDATGHGWVTTTDGLLVSEDGGDTWRHVAVRDHLFLRYFIRRNGSLWALGPNSALELVADGVMFEKFEAVSPLDMTPVS